MTRRATSTTRRRTVCAAILLSLSFAAAGTAETTETFELEVLRPDQTVLNDSATGTELTFLTTETHSSALYFHERSWLADESMIVFQGHRGLMGYLPPTGETVVLKTPTGGTGGPTAAATRNSVFFMRGSEAVELTPHIELSRDPANTRSVVGATARAIATLPGGGQLTVNCTDSLLAIGTGSAIYTVDVASGAVREICKIEAPNSWHGHLQWSHTNPYLLSFAGEPQRIWVVDIRDGVPRAPYNEIEGELVTHEAWWVDDQIMFCGAPRPHGQDQSHVKLLDIYTGAVRIVGSGNWWPSATPSELAERNWWHSAGSDDGRWAMADNWHGDIMLFEGTTTRPHMLTMGHRTYGGGDHREPGWDRSSERVIFTSHMLTLMAGC